MKAFSYNAGSPSSINDTSNDTITTQIRQLGMWMAFCALGLRLLGQFVQTLMCLCTFWVVHSGRCWCSVHPLLT